MRNIWDRHNIIIGIGAVLVFVILLIWWMVQPAAKAVAVPLPPPRPMETLAAVGERWPKPIEPKLVETVRVTQPRAAATIVGLPHLLPAPPERPVVPSVAPRTLAALPEPVTEPKEPPKAKVEVEDDPPRRAKRKRAEREEREERDICARHNLRKVVTNGGRSWRCKR